jgi:geranylgeranyl pyrophosphate synthase
MMDRQLQHQIRSKMKNDLLYNEMRSAIARMEQQMEKLCLSDHLVMAGDLKRIVTAGGKRLRPSLAFVCHHIGNHDKMEIIPLMCMLELMHTASLIHDDIVDDADIRRNVKTIHATSGRTAAIQSGDFLLGRAMEYLHIYRGTGINEALADVSTEMCLGEFQQMKSLYDPDRQTIEIYYNQIRRKTACLLATSCYAGGIAGGLGRAECEALRNFGALIGMAFQLKDDVLDFTATQAFGKTLGQDLRRGIYTLPVLYAFAHNPDPEMRKLAAQKEKTQQEMNILLDYVTDSKGIEYTQHQIRSCSERAAEALAPVGDCDEKDALIEMAVSLVKRKI